MAAKPIISYGTASFNAAPIETIKEFMSVCERHGVKELDTARIYGESEAKLGEVAASERFIISTKVPGGAGSQTKTALLEAQKTSFGNLKVDKVDIYYLHQPDAETPIAETLAAMQELYSAGKFARFGLSNFSPSKVEAVYDHCKEKNYVLPTVYQGNYNPVSRHTETRLFPVLRRLGICFYVYSAIAGGFLAKTPELVQSNTGTGRWDPNTPGGSRMRQRYNKPKMVEGLTEWHAIAKDMGVPGAELAYRYMAYHSVLKADLGDAIIVGASKPEQLDQTLKGIENGPLPKSAVDRIEKVWAIVEGEAPSIGLG